MVSFLRSQNTQRASFAEWLESVAVRVGPLVLCVLSLVGGFCLLSCSTIPGLTFIPDPDGKQVGFGTAPNWTIVYIILFPPYLAAFGVFVANVRATLNDLTESNAITGPDGANATADEILEDWHGSLRNLSIVFVLLLVLSFVQGSKEFLSELLPHYLAVPPTTPNPIDWSTVALAPGSGLNPTSALAFVAFAYFYMAVALFIFLSVLLYYAVFGWYLFNLAQRSGPYRLLLRDAELPKRLAKFTYAAWLSALLGLGAAMMMHMHADYITSQAKSMQEFIFRIHVDNSTRFTSTHFTSLGVLAYTLGLLAATLYFLQQAFARARQYYLDKIDDASWRERLALTYSPAIVAAVRSQAFSSHVVPYWPALAMATGGCVLAFWTSSVYAYLVAAILAGGAARFLYVKPSAPPSPPRIEMARDYAYEEIRNYQSGPDFAPLSDDKDLQFWSTRVPRQGVPVSRILEAYPPVCLVRLGDVSGSGALIGEGLVLTNFHVFEELKKGGAEALPSVRFFFGYLGDSSPSFTDDGIRLDDKMPCITSSPRSALDFVVLKLAPSPAVKRIRPAPLSGNIPANGSFLHLLHYPEGKPVEYSSDVVTAVSGDRRLVQYLASTRKGSSGSPCFDDKWRMVAIHQAEQAKPFGTVRQGILMAAIYASIAANSEGLKLDYQPG